MMTSRVVALLTTGFLISGGAMAENYWIKAGSGESCIHVCKQSNSTLPVLNAVKAGIYPNNGNSFYLCAAGDNRPGYQLPGYNGGSCSIPTGNREVNHSVFYCLCTDGASQPPFIGGN